MKKQLLTAVLCFAMSTVSFAAGWTGQGEAGLIKSSGNTDSENFNIGLSFINEGELWTHEFGIGYYKAAENGSDSADTLAADYIAKRGLTDRSYLFGTAAYLDDKFDGLTEQLSAAFGYGYLVIDTEPVVWDVAAGIGYRDTNELLRLDDGTEVEGKDLSGPMLLLLSDYSNQITETAQIVDSFRAELSSDNSFIENDLALIVSISDKFALKAGYLVRHNTDPAPTAKKTDKIGSMSLLYDF